MSYFLSIFHGTLHFSAILEKSPALLIEHATTRARRRGNFGFFAWRHSQGAEKRKTTGKADNSIFFIEIVNLICCSRNSFHRFARIAKNLEPLWDAVIQGVKKYSIILAASKLARYISSLENLGEYQIFHSSINHVHLP